MNPTPTHGGPRAASLPPPSHRALAMLALAVFACERPADAPRPRSIELGGCAFMRRGECGPTPGAPLTVWVEGEEAAAWVDGWPTLGPASRVGGGLRLTVPVPEGARSLVVRAPGAEARVALAPPAAAPSFEAAKALRMGGHLDEARAAAEAALATAPGERGLLLGELGRIARRQGRFADAVRLFGESMRHHRATGWTSDEVFDGVALVYTLTHEHRDLTLARATLDELGPTCSTWPAGRALTAYYEAILARETGDVMTALALLDEAAQGAERLEMAQQRLYVTQVRAGLLTSLGRASEAARVLDETLPSVAPDQACERATLLANLGWARLLEREAGATGVDAATPLRRALELLSDGCSDPLLQADVLVNRALGAMDDGRAAEALEAIGAARALGVADAEITFWSLDIEARAALAQGRAEAAVALFESLAARGRAARSPATVWRAELGAGRALQAAGRRDEAIAAWQRAEDVLETLAVRVPLGEGRGRFLGDREASARHLVGSLIARGGTREAFAAARRARARALRGAAWTSRLGALHAEGRRTWEAAVGRYLDERATLEREAAGAWELPEEAVQAAARSMDRRERAAERALERAVVSLGEPPPCTTAPAPGELWLLPFPLPDGATLLAATSAGVQAIPLAAPGAEGLRAAIAAALREAAGVRVVDVLDYGPWRGLDVAALEIDGEPLLVRFPLRTRLDVERAPTGHEGGALVVGDPRGDLPGAREEARGVAKALAPAMHTELLLGDAATATAVRAALPGAAILHYAGHGEAAGGDSLRSALPLAGGTRLRAGDVLAMGAVPGVVVLAGCETGAGDAAAPGETLGLAQAFVLAGSRAVLAAARPVSDEGARALATHLHADPALLLRDPAEAARQALLTLRRDARPDWLAFRLYVP